MSDATRDEIAMNEIMRLLAPALTEGRGMQARDREERFRLALLDLIDARIDATASLSARSTAE